MVKNPLAAPENSLQLPEVEGNYCFLRILVPTSCKVVKTTRQLLVFFGKLLVFTFNYSFFTTIPDSLKLSENYPKLDSTIR